MVRNLRKGYYDIQRMRKKVFRKLGMMKIITFAIATLFCFFTMYYADITVTSRFGLVFLDSAFDGKLLSFYANALSSGIAPEGAVYDIGMYVIFGIWSLPLWILGKFVRLDQMSVGCLLWYKLLVVLFVVLCAYEFYKLSCKLLASSEKALIGTFLFLSSVMVFFPTFVVAQYDVIGLYFMMLGVNGFLEDNNKKFICSIALAMLMKPFPIFILVLLLVIKEKNIFKIILRFICGVAPFVLLKVIYSMTDGYSASAGSFAGNGMEALFTNTMKTNGGETSIFFVVLIVLYGIAYCIKKDSLHPGYKEYVMVMLAMLWADFVVFADTAPYWIIYFEPFLLLIALLGADVNNKLIFELIANVSILVSMIFKFPWVYGGDKMYSYLVLKSLTESFLNSNSGITVAGVLRRLTLERYLPVIDAVFVASVIIVLALELRRFCLIKNRDEIDEKVNDWHIYMRIAVLFVWIIVTFGLLCLSMALRG